MSEVYLLKSEVYNSLYFRLAIAARFIYLTVLQRRVFKLKCCTWGLDIDWQRGQSRGEFLQQPHFQSSWSIFFSLGENSSGAEKLFGYCTSILAMVKTPGTHKHPIILSFKTPSEHKWFTEICKRDSVCLCKRGLENALSLIIWLLLRNFKNPFHVFKHL